jgi:hypothetical protein
VKAALSEGHTYAADVIEWEVEGQPFSVIVVAKSGAYGTEQSREALRKKSIAWAKMKRGIQEAVEEADGTSGEPDV